MSRTSFWQDLLCVYVLLTDFDLISHRKGPGLSLSHCSCLCGCLSGCHKICCVGLCIHLCVYCVYVHTITWVHVGFSFDPAWTWDRALPLSHIFMARSGELAGSCQPLCWAVSNTETLKNWCVSNKCDLLVLHSLGKVKTLTVPIQCTSSKCLIFQFLSLFLFLKNCLYSYLKQIMICSCWVKFTWWGQTGVSWSATKVERNRYTGRMIIFLMV